MRISDWSSDVCSSDLPDCLAALVGALAPYDIEPLGRLDEIEGPIFEDCDVGGSGRFVCLADGDDMHPGRARGRDAGRRIRSEEHTSELQSLMRTSYAVFCLKKKNNT